MTPRVTQVCYTTRDIEATAKAIAAIDGIGPFFCAEFPQQNLVYRDRCLGNGRVQVAFAYKGDLQYELIQAPSDAPSFYTELLGDRREAFHHTYLSSDEDYDALVARYTAAGEPLAYWGTAGDHGIRFGFLDATARLGHFIETLETRKMSGPSAEIFTYYERMKVVCAQWDGQRPIRLLAEVAGVAPAADLTRIAREHPGSTE